MITEKIPNGTRVLFHDRVAAGVGTIVSCDDDLTIGLGFLLYDVVVESGTESDADGENVRRLTPGETKEFFHKEIVEVLS